MCHKHHPEMLENFEIILNGKKHLFYVLSIKQIVDKLMSIG
jgi:hypothetical protein